MERRAFTLKFDGLVNVLKSDCGISKAFDPTLGKPCPRINTYHAIWDTGATGCVITERVAHELGLKPTGVQYVSTAGGIFQVNTYYVNLFLPNNVFLAMVKATEGKLGDDVDVLIGMDVISRGDFAITHKDHNTVFSFQMPSTHDINFNSEKEENTLSKALPIHKEKVPGRNDLCPCGSGKKYKNCCGKNK